MNEEHPTAEERPNPSLPTDGIERLLPVDEHIEEELAASGHRVRRRGIFLLPNLLTTGALFAGFYSIISAINGQFEAAAIAIFFAMVLDGLDGRVARAVHAQSAFGAEYDSLCDMVSFGVAPALLAFTWGVSQLGKVGLAAAFIYSACAALRLARFNTQIAVADKRYFTGLASPAAAALLSAWVWSGYELFPAAAQVPRALAWLTALLTFMTGLAMVLRVRYHSFKQFDLGGRVPFVLLLVVVLAFFVIALYPARMLLLGFALYALSGPSITLWRRRKQQMSDS
jgi:CDP-diacylglycerol--serine O-phosphatidyltransferase